SYYKVTYRKRGERKMPSFRKCAVSVAALAAAAFAAPALAADAAPVAAGAPATTPVTDAMLHTPPPGEWLMWRRDYSAWGYSPLDQVNARNVNQLALVWSFGTTPGRQEGTP